VSQRLGGRLWPVEPVCLTRHGSGIHRALIAYKAAAVPAVRSAASDALAELLGGWLAVHAACLLGAKTGPASLVPVPSSTGGRASWGGRHPIADCWQRAIDLSGLGEVRVEPLLCCGEHPPERLRPAADGFLVTGALPERHLFLVVDDLFASGSRAMSAAAALERAGGVVAGVVPVARFVRPEHNEATRAYWNQFGAVDARRATCSRCGAAKRRHPPTCARLRPSATALLPSATALLPSATALLPSALPEAA
jgi:predicted amidophosphoribosyltransferase